MRPLTLALALAALGACSTQPEVGIYRSATGEVSTSVAGGVGPVTVGVGSGGGYLGTSVGGVSIGAGF